MKRLLLVALLLPLAVCAQVRKCEKDGKVVYSDVLCADTSARETVIDTSKNTIDHSGLRQQAANSKAQAAARLAKEQADARKAKRDRTTDACGNVIDLSHKPSSRQKNEYARCREAQQREYNRPSY